MIIARKTLFSIKVKTKTKSKNLEMLSVIVRVTEFLKLRKLSNVTMKMFLIAERTI